MVTTRRGASQRPPSKVAKRSKHQTREKSVSPIRSKTKARRLVQHENPIVEDRHVLFRLENLVSGTLLRRPSARNKSPYVADVLLNETESEASRTIIAHVPNLDMGGKCVPESTLLLRYATDRKGNRVGADAVGKYGTPKCEFIAQLLRVDDSVYSKSLYRPTWVGAHPNLGERIAHTWLSAKKGPLFDDVVDLQTQVNNPGGICEGIRSDFLVTHKHGKYKTVVEVKTVVDTDYSSVATPSSEQQRDARSPKKTAKQKKKERPVFLSDETPYVRTALFPWGSSKQKGPDGEAVVSTRAIHHVRQLTKLHTSNESDEKFRSMILFVVIRDDAQQFRPNHEACPSFAQYLRQAHDAGVRVDARSVSWDETGCCWDGHDLPIVWPSTTKCSW